MRITVFCSANNVGEPYTSEAKRFAKLLAEKGHTLVWGGSNVGTMREIADAAQAAGGRIEGVSTKVYAQNARKNADAMVIASNLAERKAELLRLADAIVVLPGGLGTLDEITEVLELKKQAAHQKPIVFLNTNSFYDGFKMQLERMEREEFLPEKLADYLHFADTPEGVLDYLVYAA